MIDVAGSNLSLDPELYDQLTALAEQEGRSLHDQILVMLRRALQAEERMAEGRRFVDDAIADTGESTDAPA